ncbi:DUF5719 family protein [Georgenia sp. Z1344]|uniref:DUF5719 family protein n=1 Tax=Georgenia sp. Z1344 TaxID=3416706 RepID=UPI003CEFFA21
MTGRTAARAAGAAVGAVAVLALTGGALWAGQALPAPELRPAEASGIALPATGSTHVCAPVPVPTTEDTGPADPDQDEGDRTVRSTTQLHTWAVGDAPVAEAEWAEGSGAGESVGLDTVAAGESAIRSLATATADPGVLTVAPVDEAGATAPGSGGGAVVVRTDAGDLRGIAAATCQAPAASAWLVGGSTELGSTALLSLTNAGPVPVTADVTVHTAVGIVDAPALSDVVVPPRSTVQLPVEASVESPAIALRVDGRGGRLAASLEDLRTQGLASAGLDVVTAGTGPAGEVHVPVVEVAPGGTAAVRLVNPADEVVTASLDLTTEDGWTPLGGAQDVVLDPGVVLDVPLTGVAEGVHGVRVRTDGAVAASAVTTQEGASPEGSGDLAVDLAWTAAAEPASSAVHVLPGGALGVRSRIAVTNPGEAPTVVTVSDLARPGAAEEIEVTPGSTVLADAPEGATVVRVATEQADGARDDAGSDAGGEDGAPDAADGPGVLSAVLLDTEVPTGRLVGVLGAVPDARESGEIDVLVR